MWTPVTGPPRPKDRTIAFYQTFIYFKIHHENSRLEWPFLSNIVASNTFQLFYSFLQWDDVLGPTKSGDIGEFLWISAVFLKIWVTLDYITDISSLLQSYYCCVHVASTYDLILLAIIQLNQNLWPYLSSNERPVTGPTVQGPDQRPKDHSARTRVPGVVVL